VCFQSVTSNRLKEMNTEHARVNILSSSPVASLHLTQSLLRTVDSRVRALEKVCQLLEGSLDIVYVTQLFDRAGTGRRMNLRTID